MVRLSGPHVKETIWQLAGSQLQPRVASYRSIRNRNGLTVDRGFCIFFPSPASFTGEDCAELHLHGGRAVVAAILADLSARPGLRHAAAGEFTKRAFLNGKLDLAEAEALGDLIAAETEAQRRFAIGNASGGQSRLYQLWRERLLHARAMIEAELDFADEGDIPGAVSARVWDDMADLVDEMQQHAAGFHKAEIIREGFRVVILGAPNAGKSSLLNALARRDAAIVTDEPGTTRDVIEVALDLNGYKVVLSDTAGIREPSGKVEAIGIERTLAAARTADLALLLVEPGGTAPIVDSSIEQFRIRSKADLGIEGSGLAISTATGVGLAALLEILTNRVASAVDGHADVLPARLRHVELLERSMAALKTAIEGDELELRAEELRSASDALGRISGQIDPEELLGAIFSKFCIGK